MASFSDGNSVSIKVKPIIGKSRAVAEIKKFIKKAAAVDDPILFLGETGVGKEVCARNIHKLSQRKRDPFVAVNCANIPEHLAESELFGHKKGAFTDAKEDKMGLIEQAKGGTIFFDEIAECSVSLQAKLLRVIEDREVRALGETSSKEVDVRFVFATSGGLRAEIRKGNFRRDLYYRISVLKISILPLRERKEDMHSFVEHILGVINQQHETTKRISEQALACLLQFHYPGNIRELENIIKKAYVLSNGDKIQKKDIEIEEEEEEEETENVYQKMIFNGKSFWEVVHKPFLEREINRREAKRIITRGLKETGGSYKKLLAIFHIGQEEKDYKRFMKILTIHKLR